jgi:uncharacterized membrane protein
MTSQNGKFDREWLKKNRWYIIVGLIVLYLILKLFIFK